VSTLLIACDVKGALVRLRDRRIATAPIAEPIRVNAGSNAVLEVTADGYFPFRRTIDLPGGGSASVEVRLTSKQTSGLLRVESTTVGAAVSVDGHALGEVPTELVVPAGPHAINLTHDGYYGSVTSAVVAAGSRKLVAIDLESIPPITARWWFWAGVGAIVVSGVVITAALLTERSPDRGTINPGTASAQLRF
jgi:hypothetical protein